MTNTTTNTPNMTTTLATIAEGKKKLDALELERKQLIDAQIAALQTQIIGIKAKSKETITALHNDLKTLKKKTPRAKKTA